MSRDAADVTVGERLRRARIDSGLSLTELAARTRIQPWILDSIERNECARVPGGIFIRAFLRAFAREVGLDPAAIVNEYAASREVPPVTPVPATRSATVEDARASASRVWRSMGLAAAAIAAVVWLDEQRRESQPASPPGWDAVAVDEGAEQSAAAQATSARMEVAELARVALLVPDTPARTADAADLASPSAASQGLDVRIRAAGAMWLEAAIDGQPIVRRLLDAGDEEHLVAIGEITLRIGDASMLRYSINGETGRPLGGPGQVRDVRLTRDNFRSYIERASGVGNTDQD
jgi:cytoskeletal protein RodZ